MKNTFSFKHVQRKFGKGYFFATQLFPKELRDVVYTLYAFVRIPDEIVDTEYDNEHAKVLLIKWEESWKQAYEKKESTDVLLEEMSHICTKYAIPYSWTEDFLNAMIQDTEKKEYQTYEELEKYMHGAAGVVGLMMTNIIGSEKNAYPYAEKLAYAMQLTNILRDIREDYEKRGRIYIPQDELLLSNIDRRYIRDHIVNDTWKSFMKLQIKRARTLYREAEPGIDLLDTRGRKAVRLASRLYEKILDKIELADYDVFSKRAHTTMCEKLWIYITCKK